ncbi:MAG: ABC transporter permease subunit [Candidatus Omnitrophica bacterium]|nr:ABC transporter permease subunit [Candidatus Omnitrophota bacterium]
MNIQSILIIAGKEFRDAKRSRWFLIISLLFAILALALSLLGLAGLGSIGVAGFSRTAASLLNLVLLIVPLMSLLLGAMSVASEREQGTLVTLLAQPVTSSEVLLGKFLGTASALTATILLGFGLSGLVISWYGDIAELRSYLVLVGFTVLLGLASLSVGFCISIFAHKSTAAVGVALFFWFLFLFLSDLGLMGMSIVFRLPPKYLLWLTALNPPEAFKLAVIGALHGGLEVFGVAGRYAMDVFGDWFVLFLGGILTLWIFLPLASALWLFRTKCTD